LKKNKKYGKKIINTFKLWIMSKKTIIQTNDEYKDWLIELKNKVRSAQIKAAVKVNTELLKFYWELGSEIVEKQNRLINLRSV